MLAQLQASTTPPEKLGAVWQSQAADPLCWLQSVVMHLWSTAKAAPELLRRRILHLVGQIQTIITIACDQSMPLAVIGWFRSRGGARERCVTAASNRGVCAVLAVGATCF